MESRASCWGFKTRELYSTFFFTYFPSGKGMGYADVQVKYKIDANNLIKLHRLVGKDYGSIALGNSLSDLFQQTLVLLKYS